MEKINAVITGVGGYVPDYILTNEEISKMVDTTDEWIMGRIGIKERRILHEEGLGTSYMARKAAKQLMQRTGSNPDDIDLVIVATTTPDYHFPSTASILCDKLGLKHAFAFDLQAACSGFLYLLETGANFIRSGRYKKIILVGGDKMSSMVDYTERATCPIFGDGAAAVMMEPTTEDVGVMDAILRTDGKGLPFLHMKAVLYVLLLISQWIITCTFFIRKVVRYLSMPYPICRTLVLPLRKEIISLRIISTGLFLIRRTCASLMQ